MLELLSATTQEVRNLYGILGLKKWLAGQSPDSTKLLTAPSWVLHCFVANILTDLRLACNWAAFGPRQMEVPCQ
jgi:hypothetical protein